MPTTKPDNIDRDEFIAFVLAEQMDSLFRDVRPSVRRLIQAAGANVGSFESECHLLMMAAALAPFVDVGVKPGYKGNSTRALECLMMQFTRIGPKGTDAAKLLQRTREYYEKAHELGRSGIRGWELGKALLRNAGHQPLDIRINSLGAAVYSSATKLALDTVQQFNVLSIAQLVDRYPNKILASGASKGCALVAFTLSTLSLATAGVVLALTT